VAKRAVTPSGPAAPRGKRGTGRIVRIQFGQGHGFIRLPDERDVYFHRADLKDGTVFNDLEVGDAVQFELLEDAVSGARALYVTRKKR
jgi:cold shock CspA family protein